jgi:Conjugal transfer protein TrbH
MNLTLNIAGSLFVLWLSGCAQQAMMPPLPETAVNTIAKDATGQLTSLYPPAQTHFVVEQGGSDLFGNQFKSELRNCGYALHETQKGATTNKSGSKPLSYILDAMTDMSHYGYYRLTLNIGEKQLSRLYDANELTKPNYWSYRQ